MLKNINKLFYIIFSMLLIACSTGLKQEQTDRYPFNEKMKEVLGSDVEIIDAINKYEGQISSIDFPKKSQNIKKIIDIMEKDGWVLKGKGQGVDTYCLGQNNAINIVTASSKPIINYENERLVSGDYSKDTIAYVYNISGAKECD